MNLGPGDYFSNGEHIAQRKVEDFETWKSDTIFVKRHAIVRFLEETKQTLLWCLRSQRYSERHAVELGLENLKQETSIGEAFHFLFERVELNEYDRISRPRMPTMTQVFRNR